MQYSSDSRVSWTPRGFASSEEHSTLILKGGLANVLAGLRGLENPNQVTTVNMYLRGQKVLSADICEVMDALANLHQLSNLHVDLVCSGLCDAGAKGLGVALAKMDNLIRLSLDLGYCNISDVGAKDLAIGLTCQLTVLRLHLNKNQIGASGIEGLTAALAEMRQLSHLNFSFWSNASSAIDAAEYFGSVMAMLYPLTGCISMGEYARVFNHAYQARLSAAGLM